MKNKVAIKKLLYKAYYYDKVRRCCYHLEDNVPDGLGIEADSVCIDGKVFLDIVLWDLCGFVRQTGIVMCGDFKEEIVCDDHFTDIWHSFVIEFDFYDSERKFYERYRWVNSVDNYIKFLEAEIQNPENFINRTNQRGEYAK